MQCVGVCVCACVLALARVSACKHVCMWFCYVPIWVWIILSIRFQCNNEWSCSQAAILMFILLTEDVIHAHFIVNNGTDFDFVINTVWIYFQICFKIISCSGHFYFILSFPFSEKRYVSFVLSTLKSPQLVLPYFLCGMEKRCLCVLCNNWLLSRS